MARRLLFSTQSSWAALAVLTVLAVGCQPINEEPDAGPPKNHPPRIVEGFSTPKTVVINVSQASDNCTKAIDFSLGEVEDDDIDQTVQERWLLDYSPSVPDLGELVTLQNIENAPSLRTDPSPAFTVRPGEFQSWALTSSHVVDVYVSDGFATAGAPGKALSPTDVQTDAYLVRKSWVLLMDAACPSTTP